MSELDLRDFFDAYDRGDPYMRAAVSELHCKVKNRLPELLANDANWFQTWTLGGKRDLRTGGRNV
jgi:hypothetical protein